MQQLLQGINPKGQDSDDELEEEEETKGNTKEKGSKKKEEEEEKKECECPHEPEGGEHSKENEEK